MWGFNFLALSERLTERWFSPCLFLMKTFAIIEYFQGTRTNIQFYQFIFGVGGVGGVDSNPAHALNRLKGRNFKTDTKMEF